MKELIFLYSLGISLLFSSTLGIFVVKYGKKLKIIDNPKTHLHPKVTHSIAVPRGGGLLVYPTLAISALLFLPWTAQMFGILIGAGMLFVVGFFDDRFEERVSPYLRFLINIAAAGIVVMSGIGISYVTHPFQGVLNFTPLISVAFTIVWLTWMQNIIGWSSGVDGQLPGFVVIAALVMAALSLRFPQDPSQMFVLILSAIVVGCYGGMMLWNWFPQRLMPGYGGKSIAGFLLGILAIYSGAKVGAMMIVLAIPFIDATFLIFKRLSQGRSPVWGGREHFHHALLSLGWSRQKIAIAYLLIATVFGLMALELRSVSKYFTMATIGLVFGGILIWLHYFSTYLKPQDHDSG